MKKMVMIAACTAALLCGCADVASAIDQANTEYIEKQSQQHSFRETLVPVPGYTDLVYDTTTKNVFILFTHSYIPYPAPNGFPYQYDEATRSLVENDSLEKILEELKEN